MKTSHKVITFHTGDGAGWCFEVLDNDGSLLGEGRGFESEKDAREAGENFSTWYYS